MGAQVQSLGSQIFVAFSMCTTFLSWWNSNARQSNFETHSTSNIRHQGCVLNRLLKSAAFCVDYVTIVVTSLVLPSNRYENVIFDCTEDGDDDDFATGTFHLGFVRVIRHIDSFRDFLCTTQPILHNMRPFRARFNLGLLWLSIVVKNVECCCPYTEGVEYNSRTSMCISLKDNEKVAKKWPSFLTDIDKRRFVISECNALCILSNGFEKIKLREKVMDSCELTLADALTSQDTQDTPTDQDPLLPKSGDMVEVGQTSVLGDEKVFVKLEVCLYNGDDSTKTSFFIDVSFNFTMDHMEVPKKVFEDFKNSKRKHLTLLILLNLNIKIQVKQSMVKLSETDNYVFGKVVLKHVRYMVEDDNIRQSISIGRIAQARPTYSRTDSFMSKSSIQGVNKFLKRTFSMN